MRECADASVRTSRCFPQDPINTYRVLERKASKDGPETDRVAVCGN